ncbi:hypothetical protein PMM47T1_04879 [Pseudomonas sp. M47T1]|uniref:DUF1120 domain-containing protein n=1 Tax=Pseudomonas sp. M47T1 TaxID=1179778 RepID=UPI0002608288|nr:DUF1120 domain-containing protein [Pseudomonas sp. M47T1]EIK97818.1 hypothetical protein PMM47T1_04879 [Pseudomonas sp. M47T1]
MNTIKSVVAAALLASTATSAIAASSVDLAVTGSIVPMSCTPTLSRGDVVFSKISSSDLKTGAHTMIAQEHLQTLNINCQAATLFGIRGVDNRAGTHGNSMFVTPYGLGLTPSGEKTGAHYLEVYPTRSTVDGKPAFVTVGTEDGSSWIPSSSGERGIRNFGPLLGFNDTLGVTTGPIPIKDAALGLKHYLVINDAATLTLNEEVLLDGSASIEVVYL